LPRHTRVLALTAVLVVSGGVPLLSALAQRSARTTASALEDVQVNRNRPAQNLYGRAILRVDSDPTKVAYLRFDVGDQQLSAGAPSLELFSFTSHPGLEVHRVDAATWGDDITWAGAPNISDDGIASGPIEAGSWVSVDVSSLVTSPEPTTLALTTSAHESALLSSIEGGFVPRLAFGDHEAPPEPRDSASPEPTPSGTPEPTPTASGAEPASGVVGWVAETDAVRGHGDVADDPAIWIDQDAPSHSAIFATDKDSSGGMYAFGLDGKQHQFLPTGAMNNVDLRYGFDLAGRTIDLVGASNRSSDSLDFFEVTPGGTLAPAGSVATDLSVYGFCMYRSPQTDDVFAFVTSHDGRVEQYRLGAQGATVIGTMVRSFEVGSESEGCVADDESQAFYVSQEAEGVWRYEAEPGDGSARTEVDSVDSGHLHADVEGLSIFYGANGDGYVIVSSQGDDTFAVYDRNESNDYVGSFAVGGAGDDVTQTDGVDATSTSLGGAFTEGLLVVHDHSNQGAPTSNYKFVAWSDVATALGLGSTSVAPGQTGAATTARANDPPDATNGAVGGPTGVDVTRLDRTRVLVSTKVLRRAAP
jgi:3-phytase